MKAMRSVLRWVGVATVVVGGVAPPVARALDPTLARPGRGASSQTAQSSRPDPLVPNADAGGAAAARRPIPDAAAQLQANKVVDQVYREQVAAARTPDQRRALGQQFLRKAVETTTDPAGKFALFARARDLAADAGDADTCLAAILGVEQAFAVEPGAADLETVGRLAKNSRGAESQRTLARYLMGSANESVAADKYEAAKRLADMAQSAAAKANDPSLLRATTTRAREVREVEAAFAEAKPALDAIAKGTADADQALGAGRFRCFYKGDWPGGLPLLSRGANATLKDLAARETIGTTGADEQAAVADGWWAEAEKGQGVARNLLMAHARSLYLRAEPALSGLPKDKAAKRAQEAEGLAAIYVPRAGWVRPPELTGPRPTAAVPPGPAAPTGGTGAAATKPTAPTTGGVAQLPPQFNREWRSPAVWANKPEQVTLADGKVSITNEGGANSVCKDEPLVPQKDGSLVLQWNYGEAKRGYEVWMLEGKEWVIRRWNTKAEKDGGRDARRVGAVTGS